MLGVPRTSGHDGAETTIICHRVLNPGPQGVRNPADEFAREVLMTIRTRNPDEEACGPQRAADQGGEAISLRIPGAPNTDTGNHVCGVGRLASDIVNLQMAGGQDNDKPT